jgi:hypothetical protein
VLSCMESGLWTLGWRSGSVGVRFAFHLATKDSVIANSGGKAVQCL